jgi:ribosome biogenesis GTPase / thiamine phosphate phosphatase
VVIAPEPPPHANLLDRYLAAAEDAGLHALILLNKTDLGAQAAALEPLLDVYRAIGYPVLRASAAQAGGIAALAAALAGHTTAFVGQSGVGKSSLIATLLPHEDIRVGELSQAVAKGRHTTTTARLYHLPAGGKLIDSPGIREFSLVHLDSARTARGFIEFRPYLGCCRFRDCEHRDEPGCALREAVDAGAVSAARYAGYLQIIGERP